MLMPESSSEPPQLARDEFDVLELPSQLSVLIGEGWTAAGVTGGGGDRFLAASASCKDQ